jgi:hypothetical protein
VASVEKGQEEENQSMFFFFPQIVLGEFKNKFLVLCSGWGLPVLDQGVPVPSQPPELLDRETAYP